MYDVTNKTKKELVEEICRQLNDHGLTDTNSVGEVIPYTVDRGFMRGFMYLPIENLQRIVNCEVTDWSEMNKVYNTWGRAGALTFVPYSDHSDDNPSLVIRHNRFLHMFRGYHFQASWTVDGIGDAGSGSYRTDFLVRSEYWQCVLRGGLLAYMLWWAAFIDVGFQFRNFEELFTSDVSVLEDFLKESAAYWHRDFDYKWSDVEKYIKFSNDAIDVNARTMYQIEDDNTVGAYLAIGRKTVQVQTKKGLWTLTIPDLVTGVEYSYDDPDELEEEIEILERNHYREMFAVMLLKLAGIHISFINWYPIDGRKAFESIRPINAPGVIKARSLNEIYKAVPDEF